MKVKAIETHYNGRKFRSRLEARWAVFFDKLGLEFRYEPEGFDFDGLWYLPDFWLPKLDVWIEIKPKAPDREASSKATLLAEFMNRPVYIFYGDLKSAGSSWSSDGDHAQAEIFPSWDYGYLWCECDKCGSLGIEFEGRSDRLSCRSPGGKCSFGISGDWGRNADSSRLRMAYEAASTTDFVHAN